MYWSLSLAYFSGSNVCIFFGVVQELIVSYLILEHELVSPFRNKMHDAEFAHSIMHYTEMLSSLYSRVGYQTRPHIGRGFDGTAATSHRIHYNYIRKFLFIQYPCYSWLFVQQIQHKHLNLFNWSSVDQNSSVIHYAFCWSPSQIVPNLSLPSTAVSYGLTTMLFICVTDSTTKASIARTAAQGEKCPTKKVDDPAVIPC